MNLLDEHKIKKKKYTEKLNNQPNYPAAPTLAPTASDSLGALVALLSRTFSHVQRPRSCKSM